MKLITEIEKPKHCITLKPTSVCLTLGSCFAAHVGERMKTANIDVCINPFGTLYNPESISTALQLALKLPKDSKDNFDNVFQGRDGYWHSWLHNTRFSGETKEECISKVKQSIAETNDYVNKANFLFITFGTNHVYRLSDGRTVVNCHKELSSTFTEHELSVNEIVDNWNQLLTLLPEEQQIVFTVSPYRYAKYGFHESQISKAVLFLAVEEIIKCNSQRCFYFPAYEIVCDELRDYRFYSPDMLHISEQAADYVWQRFREWYFSEEMKKYACQYEQSSRQMKHIPLINPTEN